MKDRISKLIEEKRDYYVGLSDDIWAHPELGYHEYHAAEVLIKALEENGFAVEKNLAGIPTAFKGVYGSGKPVIGFLGEFDALAGLSQEAGNPEKCPVHPGEPGHGCGHNSMTPCCLASAVAMKQLMEESGASGTIVVYGCPAEEQGCGKSFMTREGVFDELDIALAPHPMANNMVFGSSLLANIQAEFSFTGRAAHAAVVPEQGNSALDAADLMIVGVQFLREHVVQEARIHHAYLDVGGTSPNVVQASAKLLFYIRAPKSYQSRDIFEKMKDVARGAALMTGTSVEINVKSAMVELVPNDTLGTLVSQSWKEIGPCQYSKEAKEVAAKIAPSFSNKEENPIDDCVPEYVHVPGAFPGSSDVGDVSFKIPTVMVNFAGLAKGTPGHSWQWVSQAGTALMHDGMIHCAKVLAYTGMKLLENPALVDQAKEELQKATGGKYECLIPPEVKPDI